jgi:hypothetical protein
VALALTNGETLATRPMQAKRFQQQAANSSVSVLASYCVSLFSFHTFARPSLKPLLLTTSGQCRPKVFGHSFRRRSLSFSGGSK